MSEEPPPNPKDGVVSVTRSATKTRVFTDNDRILALAFLSASRVVHESGDPEKTKDARLRDAARRSNVPENLLRDWAQGGDAGIWDPSEEDDKDGIVFERPMPPPYLLDPDLQKAIFMPAYDCMDWIKAVFIDEGGPLYNETHYHLLTAKIGVMWTNLENRKNGQRKAGTCEFLGGGGAIWPKGRADFQLRQWFGEMPDFLITFDAKIAARYSDRRWCGLAEHELLHAGIRKDRFNAPCFDQYGRPLYASRGHDSEEFVAIAGRYGVEGTGGETAELVAAANTVRPLVSDAHIRVACGRKSDNWDVTAPGISLGSLDLYDDDVTEC